MHTLRFPGILILLGLLGLVAGTLAWVVGSDPFDHETIESVVYQIALTIGYSLAGLACWRWIVGCWATNVDPSVQRIPSRLMAAASAVTAAAFAALTVLQYENHRQLLHTLSGIGTQRIAVIDPHYRLRMAGGASIVVGLLLASVGFWIASSATRTAGSEPQEPAVPVG